MSILLYPGNFTLTAASGTASDVLVHSNKFIYQIFVKAATSTTTFDFKLTSFFSNDTFERTNNTGILNEFVKFPMVENVTLTISNASVDEEFKIELPNQGR